MDIKKVLKDAKDSFEILRTHDDEYVAQVASSAFEQCKQAIEWLDSEASSRKQEPVGIVIEGNGYWYKSKPENGAKLYLHPLESKQLSDDEINKICKRLFFTNAVGY